MAMMLLCLANQVYLGHAQIFVDRSAYRTEIINDFVVLVCAIFAYILLAIDTNPEATEASAVSLSLLIVGNLGIFTIMMVCTMLVQLRLKLKMKAT